MNYKTLWLLEIIVLLLSSAIMFSGLVIAGGMVIYPIKQSIVSDTVFWSSSVITILIIHTAWPFALKYIILLINIVRAFFIARRVNNNGRPGYIYVFRRSDGIYKIGHTVNLGRRLKQHEKDYGLEFELMIRFVVSDVDVFEKLALEMTKDFFFKEKRRRELRKMPDYQLYKFVKMFGFVCTFSAVRGRWFYAVPPR